MANQRDRRFDTVRITAWSYAVYLVTLVPAYALEKNKPMPAGALQILWAFWVMCAAAAASAAYRRRVGYYFCALLSVLMLCAPPIGTLLGWNMLRALRRNRDQFLLRASRVHQQL